MPDDIVSLLENALRLSKVKEDEKVALLTTHIYDERLLSQFVSALTKLSAHVLRIIAPPREVNGRLVPPFLHNDYGFEVLKEANIVVQVASNFPAPVPGAIGIYSDRFNDILRGGTRWIEFMLHTPEINYRRLFPTEALRRRSLAGAEIMEKAKIIRFTSDAGTDLTMDKTGRKGHCQYGAADEPGRWDNYGCGLVACSPKEDSTNGVFVIEPGDYIPSINLDVTEPIRCTLKDGYVRKIEGGASAKFWQRWLESFKDPDSFALSGHVGWGTHIEGSVWRESPLFCTADYESFPGGMQNHCGINIFDTPTRFAGLGGKNRAKSHGGPTCRNLSQYLDDELIVDKGKIVHPKCL